MKVYVFTDYDSGWALRPVDETSRTKRIIEVTEEFYEEWRAVRERLDNLERQIEEKLT